MRSPQVPAQIKTKIRQNWIRLAGFHLDTSFMLASFLSLTRAHLSSNLTFLAAARTYSSTGIIPQESISHAAFQKIKLTHLRAVLFLVTGLAISTASHAQTPIPY